MKTRWLWLASAVLFASAFAAQAQMLGGPGGIEQARPWLGVAIDKGPHGVLVKDALKGTPAQEAGLDGGDEITAVDQTPVHEPEELIKAVLNSGVGTTVTVHWMRKGKEMTRKVKLVARPDQLAMLKQQLEGKPVPPFSLAVVRGDGPGASAGLKGKVAVVEFWATWCPACRSTHERLSEWALKHHNDAVVLAVSDEEAATIKEYGDHLKPNFTLLADSDHKMAGNWLVSAIPELVVVGKDGLVKFATIGAGSSLEEALDAAEGAIKR